MRRITGRGTKRGTVRKWLALLVGVPLLASQLAGCATNPATGEEVFTGGLTKSQEVKMGRDARPGILKEFNGVYRYKDLDRYVSEIGQKLARVSDRRDVDYSFTVVNSDIVNAFATPGGYIYVSRGLIALADNESQLAAVLAHEIGHVAALHHAQQYGTNLLANLGLAAAGIFGGEAGAKLGQLGAVSLLRSFSREHEYQADQLGVRYLARAGYDPGAMATFLTELRADSRLTMIRRGESPDKVDQFNYLATHPAPAARVARAAELARATDVKNPIVGRDAYLSEIDGMLYGDDPDQGFLVGREFYHPVLRFAFELPPGFSLFNTQQAVYAFGPDKAKIVFDGAPKKFAGSMQQYLRAVWAPNADLREVETIKVNGMEAATAATTARLQDGSYDARLVAYRYDKDAIYRFVFLTQHKDTAKLSTDLRRTTYSFRKLPLRESINLKPLVVQVVTVRPGDTVDSLAARMAYPDYRVQRFRVLNGLKEGAPLKVGEKVKIVTKGS